MTNNKDQPHGGNNDAWIAWVIVAFIAGVAALGYGLWLVVGVLAGLLAAALARNARISGKAIAATAAAAVLLGGVLAATSGPDWVRGFKDELTTKTAAEMRQERREARKAARQSGSDYVDPKPERGLANVPDLHYSAAFKAHGAHLALLAIPVALLTFCGAYWPAELRRRRKLADELERQRKVELEWQLQRDEEDDRTRRIIREELDRSRGDEGPAFS